MYASPFSLCSDISSKKPISNGGDSISSCREIADRFFDHFREKMGGEESVSNSRQFAYLDAVIDAWSRIFFRAEMNCSTFGLLLFPPLPRMHELSNSIRSCDHLYVKTKEYGLFARLRTRCANRFALFAAITMPLTNVWRRCFSKDLPFASFNPTKYSPYK